MNCSKCGNQLNESDKFCDKCGTKVGSTKENNTTDRNYKEGEKVTDKIKSNIKDVIKLNKIKFNIKEVINPDEVISSTNRVAYIAKTWALQVKGRGDFISLLSAIILLVLAIYYGIDWGDAELGISFFISAIVTFIVVRAVFNTIAFVIRMGAEVIQLLDDIKNK